MKYKTGLTAVDFCVDAVFPHLASRRKSWGVSYSKYWRTYFVCKRNEEAFRLSEKERARCMYGF